MSAHSGRSCFRVYFALLLAYWELEFNLSDIFADNPSLLVFVHGYFEYLISVLCFLTALKYYVVINILFSILFSSSII